MKKISIVVVFAMILMAWFSCTRIEEQGTLRFGLVLSDNAELKSTSDDHRVSAALVSVVSEDGGVIFDKEYLPLYRFGEAFTSQSLKIPVGNFHLTEFMLIDSMGTVLWATPVEGSALAHLVEHPLPIHFGISSDETTVVDLQVVRVANHPPADFGYVSFNIGFVNRFCLKIDYVSRCMEEWNDSILGPDGTSAPVHQPRLQIFSGDRMLLDEPLESGLNQYIVPLAGDWYSLIASDCHGDVIYMKKFRARELLEHRCGDQYPPLIIHRDPPPGIVITPEGLEKPDIRQGVFGSVTVPVKDSTDREDYPVKPVVRDIYFYPYTLIDSLMASSPNNCYFPEIYLPDEPTAIVRSNSGGFFQLPLKTGEYLYLVKEEAGFYMDAYISSHRPGNVMVYPEEVTEMRIHIIDCSMWQ
jgi:hypothetical protein